MCIRHGGNERVNEHDIQIRKFHWLFILSTRIDCRFNFVQTEQEWVAFLSHNWQNKVYEIYLIFRRDKIACFTVDTWISFTYKDNTTLFHNFHIKHQTMGSFPIRH